jgi:glc operon protein GlcG
MRLGQFGIVALLLAAPAVVSLAAQAPAPAPARGEAAAPVQNIDLATAKQMVAAAEAAALQARAKVGIAVVDANGDLVYSERLDGASARGVVSAQGKARAAVLFGLPTKQVRDAIDAGKPLTAKLTPPVSGAELTINQGGLPIIKDGKVIGGIGAGGSASSEDERFAQAGLDAVSGHKP